MLPVVFGFSEGSHCHSVTVKPSEMRGQIEEARVISRRHMGPTVNRLEVRWGKGFQLKF